MHKSKIAGYGGEPRMAVLRVMEVVANVKLEKISLKVLVKKWKLDNAYTNNNMDMGNLC